MDRSERAANAVKELYEYRRSGNPAPLIKEVCRYFDVVKNCDLTSSDASFLLFLANEAGVPHYYDLLEEKYQTPTIQEEDINLLTLGAHIHDCSLLVDATNDIKLHRYQKAVLMRFSPEKENRYVLTAPTSFGKTYIIYEIMSKMDYNNILLVFPSISLLSENFQKIRQLNKFSQYKIHTLSEEIYSNENKNIFIFTPERYLSFLDKNKEMRFDFSFVDEVYKIDNSFTIDQETIEENERDVAYRLALKYICDSSFDMMLAGPYITLPNENQINVESFANFAEANRFSFLNYNNIEIVDKEYNEIRGKQSYLINDKVVEIGSVNKPQKIANIITALSTPDENTIVYCSRRSDTESYAKKIIENQSVVATVNHPSEDSITSVYSDFISHLERIFGSDWIVLNALKHNIGIHHSLIPKYIQKEIISLFNQGALLALFSTTTITEGVNTTAKNLLVTSSKKGLKPLKKFDAKNIAGRAGRFNRHYMGRIISIDKDFMSVIDGEEDILKHKNYDESTPKTDIDFQITDEKYLSKNDLSEKRRINTLIQESGIPMDVFNAFRIVGPVDKLKLYQAINQLSQNELLPIRSLTQTLAQSKASNLNWDGFQLIMDTIQPIVKEKELVNLIGQRVKSGHSLITVLLSNYLADGYIGMVKYYVETKCDSKDNAIRKVSNFVYNVFKYHLVKYLGLFDIFYRHVISTRTNRSIDDVSGVGILLQKLEYNALTPKARRLSDFGVPFRIVSYYDQDDTQHEPKQFDAYEQHIDAQIQELLD